MTNDDIKAMVKATALGDECLAEIGRITVHFALLELALVDLTHRLLGLPERRARVITSELSFRGLQQLASSLVRERRPQEVQRLDAILKRVATCEDKRNVVSHSMWGFGGLASDGSPIVIRTKYNAKQSRGLRFMRQEMTTIDLYVIAQEMSVVTFDLEAFASSLGLKKKSGIHSCDL